jgi:deoxyribonuclease-4
MINEATPIAAPVYDDEDAHRPAPVAAPEPPAWCDGSIRIGIHTSIAGDIAGSLDTARKLGCNALQIFSGSPRMWPRPGTRIPAQDAERFRARRAELAMGPVVIHANYLINLASVDSGIRVRAIQAFHDELIRANELGADYLVVHPGAAMGARSEDAVSAAAQALRQAARGVRLADNFADMAQRGVRVLVENTSGMGSCIGMRFAELRSILDQTRDLPIGVCLDTAHAFEAGYDLRTPAGLDQMLADLDGAVGLARVPVIHMNDSKTPLGSRVDRHQNIGQGEIGRQAFRNILNHPRLMAGGANGLRGRAFILETPIDAPGDDRKNVRSLWDLAGVSEKDAPGAESGFSMLRSIRQANPAKPAAKTAKKAPGGKRSKAKAPKTKRKA